MISKPQAIIFDLDGTLTKPALDFDAMRAEIGIEKGTIMEQMETMSEDQVERAWRIIERFEEEAARNSELNEGAGEVLESLRAQGLKIAILTRNSRKSVRAFLEKHSVSVDYFYTREDGPVKPSPQPVTDICSHLGISPQYAWMVGDYLYDLRSGHGAGATAVLIINDSELPDYANEADFVIHRLPELIQLIECNGVTGS